MTYLHLNIKIKTVYQGKCSLLGPGAPSYFATELPTGRSVVATGPDCLDRLVVADPSLLPPPRPPPRPLHGVHVEPPLAARPLPGA